ncbi:hypothetical protein pb186bvf_008827 [Paramecium bursaria]
MKENQINIITPNKIRYQGTLSSVDKMRKVAILKDVHCYGTEDRLARIPAKQSYNKIHFIQFPMEYMRPRAQSECRCQLSPDKRPQSQERVSVYTNNYRQQLQIQKYSRLFQAKPKLRLKSYHL